MNKIIVFVVGYLLMQNITFAQTPTYHNDQNWQLKWEDDFSTLNSDRWLVKNNFDHYGKEPQVYRTQNSYTNNGNLILEVKSEEYCCPPGSVNPSNCARQDAIGNCYQYTSGWVETKPAYKTQFGYIETRIKFPYREGEEWGFWPAFWTFSSGAENAAEIDICEIFNGTHDMTNTITTCVHTCYHNEELYPYPEIDPDCIKPSLGRVHTFPNFDYTDWHTYAVEWDANRITWYVDSIVFRTLENKDFDNNGNSIMGPVRIILNLAIQKDSKYHPPTSPPFSERMYVDYVKVYQLKCSNTIINEIPNFNEYCYTVKKSISLSSATTIPAGENITLRATDYIELANGFEVPPNTELYLDINPCSGSYFPCPAIREGEDE